MRKTRLPVSDFSVSEHVHFKQVHYTAEHLSFMFVTPNSSFPVSSGPPRTTFDVILLKTVCYMPHFSKTSWLLWVISPISLECLNNMGVCMLTKTLWSCSTLCDPMDYTPPGSSIHGISQARILEWVAMQPGGSSPTQGSNPSLLHLSQADSLPAKPPGKPQISLLPN